MAALDQLSRHDAAHLLRRAGFGGSDAELVALTGASREDAVSAVMGFTSTDATPQGPDVGVPGFVNNSAQWEARGDAIEWWIQRMADLDNPTTVPGTVPAVSASIPIWEKLSLFWHEHFACGQDKVSDFPRMWDQIRMFRRMAMGDFENLVRATAVHPAMLVFLDNQSNVADGIQENFARELMELHTCGVGNFTEEDVVSMARAWTGHNTVGWTGSRWDPTYQYRPDRHDHGPKKLFGITANWNGVQVEPGERDTVTELVKGEKQPETARFVAAKLFRYFAHLTPAEATIDELADAFVAADMEIAALVRAVLLHDDFWAEQARHGLVKSPVEFVVSLVRRSGLPANQMGLPWSMEPMGMTLFDPPSVKGWGQGEYWLGTVSAWARGGFARHQRWRAEKAGLLAELESDPDDEAAAAAIFALFGLEEVSATTRDAVERWHRRTYQHTRWAAAPQGFLVGALCPEFHLY